MTQRRRVTTRQLLRDFKRYKDLLLQRRIACVSITVDGDRELELSLKKEGQTGKELAQLFVALPSPIDVERADLFQELTSSR